MKIQDAFAPLRRAARVVLDATGLYSSFEWSPPHRLFIRFNNPTYDRIQRADIEFYRPIVRPGALVFDVGANNGSKSEVFLRLGARVVAFDPDPKSFAILNRRFPFNSRFKCTKAALGAQRGRQTLYVESHGSAYNTLNAKWRENSHKASAASIEVTVTTLDDEIARYGRPDFLKIDVEGYELQALSGLHTEVPALSFEANLPTFAAETRACLEKIVSISPKYRFRVAADLTEGWLTSSDLNAAEAWALIERRGRFCEVFAFLRHA